MGRTVNWILGIMATTGIALLAMQNCSRVDFDQYEKQADLKRIEASNQLVVSSKVVIEDEEGQLVEDPSFRNLKIVSCDELNVKDIIIDILGIEVKMSSGEAYQLEIGSGPADLFDLARGIDFIPNQTMTVVSLNVLLGSDNYVLTQDEKMFPLQSLNSKGNLLQAYLPGEMVIAKDVTYHLKMDFDPLFHVRQGDKGCGLHPNVRASIE